MSEQIQAYPLQWPAGWPRTKNRQRAKFSTKGNSAPNPFSGYRAARQLSVSDGLGRVGYELERLGVQSFNVIISSNIELRLDGLPRSGRPEPLDPGAAVYWRNRAGVRKVMAVDLYDRVADNLAAIAATLEAMRAIERHGGAQILERAFTGFTALPAPPTCWSILGLGEGASAAAIEATWRGKIRELRATHPGGDHHREAEINAARDEALRQVRS